MLSIRAAARSAPRALSRLSSSTIRQSSIIARPSLALKSSWAPLRTIHLTSSFSTTPSRREPASEVDEELSVKLGSELQFENEMKENEQLPASVKDFLDNSSWELKDAQGKEDVFLTRTFGNETITVSFSISDLANYDPDMYNEDSALTDEELSTPEGKRLAESEAAAAEAEAEEDADADADEAGPAVPCRLNVVVEKPGRGALNIEAVSQDGRIMVENFYYFKDPKMAHADSADVAHAAEEVYPGPPFGSLDEDLQILMERYLEERGVSQALAVFVPDYMDVKEQREYQAWLKDVKAFIDA